jgi:xanthine dehydrogenase small subunit
VPVHRFYTGYRTSVRRPDELITAVRVPATPANFSQYRKVATRRAQAISKVLVAIRGERRGDGGFDGLAIGIGSVAPTPIRAGHAEAAIAAHRGAWDAGALAAVEAALARDLHPIDDLRSTARYRSAVAFNIIRRAVVSSS